MEAKIEVRSNGIHKYLYLEIICADTEDLELIEDLIAVRQKYNDKQIASA